MDLNQRTWERVRPHSHRQTLWTHWIAELVQRTTAAMTMPNIKNALALASLSDLNSMAANKAPRFPPAPTMPETDPTARGRISGATAKVTPHAMHTNNPKRRKARSGRTKSCQSRKHHHEASLRTGWFSPSSLPVLG